MKGVFIDRSITITPDGRGPERVSVSTKTTVFEIPNHCEHRSSRETRGGPRICNVCGDELPKLLSS